MTERLSNAFPSEIKRALPMFSSFRNFPVPTVMSAEEGPTLSDLFKGRPTDEYSAGAPVFWEGDPAGQIFNIADGVLRIKFWRTVVGQSLASSIPATFLASPFSAAIFLRRRR